VTATNEFGIFGSRRMRYFGDFERFAVTTAARRGFSITSRMCAAAQTASQSRPSTLPMTSVIRFMLAPFNPKGLPNQADFFGLNLVNQI
jgi:hypothetical protein